MPLTDALSVVSVQDVKDELLVDFPDDDGIIENKIKAAVSLLEQETQWRFYPRSETVQTSSSNAELFQFPITTVTAVNSEGAPLEFRSTYKPLRRVISFDYCTYPYKVLTLQTGASELSEIPPMLVEAIKRQAVFLYENRDMMKAVIPTDVQQMISQFRRFTYF